MQQWKVLLSWKQPRMEPKIVRKQQQKFLLQQLASHPKLRVIGQGRRKSRLHQRNSYQYVPQYHWLFPCFCQWPSYVMQAGGGHWPLPPQKQSKVTQLSSDMLCLQGLLCGGSFNVHRYLVDWVRTWDDLPFHCIYYLGLSQIISSVYLRY